jgi:putative aldouronate transport system permease protein
MSICAVLPFLILIGSSFSNEQSIIKFGYTVWPRQFGTQAYQYILSSGSTIITAYGVTVFVTIVGTAGSLIVSSMLAYPLSRNDFPLSRPLMFIVLFTILFNGGLVPTYMIYTMVFNIKNTIAALIFPNLFMNGFNIIIMRTYFKLNIPFAVVESAKIDGASEMRTFFKIILPLSLPILATVGILSGLMYWNDWMNGLYYLTDTKLYNLQNVLNQMIQQIQFLQQSSNVNMDVSKLPSTTLRMAIAVIGSVPLLIIYPFFQKYFAKGLTVGSVKG